MAKITVLPDNKIFTADAGEVLDHVLGEQGIEINAICGGKGTCGKCKIVVAEGEVKGELLSDGTYLACKTEVIGDIVVRIPKTNDAAARKSALYEETSVTLNIGAKKIFVTLPKPSLQDQRPDWERLISFLPEGVNYLPALGVLETLPNTLRDGKFQVTVVLRGNMVVGVEKGDTTAQLYGVAFDIGTTSVVGTLVDLSSGKGLAARSVANPQRVVGADVIARIEYVDNHEDGNKFLKEKIITALNDLISQLLEASGVDRHYLYEVTVVGNTTMHHLLLGINPANLARSPYIPAVKSGITLSGQQLGINLSPGGVVYILPNIAGFVGSDTVGVILATGMHRSEKIKLAIDIGTNGEIALGSRECIMVCSTAAGPAFEGAQIKCGMRAADGAIEGIEITDQEVMCKVIGDSHPVLGICGSGLIQGIAEMLRVGIIERSGRLIDPESAREKLSPALAERVVAEGENMFILVPEDVSKGQKPIYISQKDVRELQLAEGAIAAGIQILMKEMNISLDDIEEVLLAGAFGSYIDRSSAKMIGLVPLLPLEKIKSVGNAAGVGARLALLSIDEKEDAEKIAAYSKNVELSTRLDFQQAFVEAMTFPALEK